MARKQNIYLTSDEIYDEWKKWKKTGVISETMGQQMLTLADHVMKSHSFCGYPYQMKQDMIQEGVIKIMKNLKNMKEEYHGSFFSYWTRCVWTSSIVYLREHYKEVNMRRQMILDKLEELKCDGKSEDVEFIKLLKEQLEEYNGSNEEDEEIV